LYILNQRFFFGSQNLKVALGRIGVTQHFFWQMLLVRNQDCTRCKT